MRKADVIIPTFKPGDKLEKLLRRLLEQSVPVGRVIIMNTEEKYWDAERFESLFEVFIKTSPAYFFFIRKGSQVRPL